jgi:lysine 2,3-aminomutase
MDYAGASYPDQNIHGDLAISHPIKMMWLATNYGIGGAKPDFFIDMLQLFRQLSGKLIPGIPRKEQVQDWMDRYPAGTDPKIANLRKMNRNRIISILIEKMDAGAITSEKYTFLNRASHSGKKN